MRLQVVAWYKSRRQLTRVVAKRPGRPLSRVSGVRHIHMEPHSLAGVFAFYTTGDAPPPRLEPYIIWRGNDPV